MRNIIIGIVAGLIVGGGVGWAAAAKQIRILSSTGSAISSSNPLPIQSY